MSSAEHERLLRRARAQDAALFRYRLIGPALEEGLTTGRLPISKTLILCHLRHSGVNSEFKLGR